jgi:catechol 2,3-dioxygenase-like lactoylglutathione lyase family enzyme
MRIPILLMTATALWGADAPKRPKITGVAHIALFVSDIDKARTFYKGLLGYGEPFQLTNKDGKLSKDELAAWHKAKMAEGGRMRGHDAGYKDPEDMTTRRAQRREECFNKADTNHDGQLSRDEFNKMGEVCGMGHGGRGHMPPPAPPAPPAAPVAPVKK